MPFVILFAFFAAFGLVLVALDFGAKMNSPAPSMYRSDISGIGFGLFVVCGLISAAAYFSF